MLCYFLTIVCGTGHIIYSLLPIIAESAKKQNIAPEQSMAMSVIASQQAIVASPLSAATILLATILAPYNIGLTDIIIITIPASIMSITLSIVLITYIKSFTKKQKVNLEKTEILTNNTDKNNSFKKDTYPYAKKSIFLFVLGVFFAISMSVKGSDTNISQSSIIQMTMLAIAGIITIICKIPGPQLTKQSVFFSGIQAIIAILGVAWLSDSFIQSHKDQLLSSCFDIIKIYPWSFCLLAFTLSIFLYSQSVTVQILFPLALSLGVSPVLLLAFYPSVCGYFFIPNYPTIIAAIQFDNTGSTKIGSYILNHSFMLPGCLATIFSIIFTFSLSYLRYYL